jgi:hypothetical protein
MNQILVLTHARKSPDGAAKLAVDYSADLLRW